MNHRIGRVVFALIIGLLVASFSYRWISNPEGREERALQVSVVESSRVRLKSSVGIDSLQIVDPLSPNRKAGKVYIYSEGDGWAVSGYYRRNENDRWHPYLMTLNPDLSLGFLKLQDRDSQLIDRAVTDPLLEVSP
jgi:hypothetical protein